ncbi:circumsporozoite protein-like [Benincasa hispida]|uniref:circumsporozoite protein-like n=1 Tax=Benincasa hispida TaxID=102211 RepID=UPI0018FF7140|nr:circumsporozoite protein-like [Benincasa hispida]
MLPEPSQQKKRKVTISPRFEEKVIASPQEERSPSRKSQTPPPQPRENSPSNKNDDHKESLRLSVDLNKRPPAFEKPPTPEDYPLPISPIASRLPTPPPSPKSKSSPPRTTTNDPSLPMPTLEIGGRSSIGELVSVRPTKESSAMTPTLQRKLTLTMNGTNSFTMTSENQS